MAKLTDRQRKRIIAEYVNGGASQGYAESGEAIIQKIEIAKRNYSLLSAVKRAAKVMQRGVFLRRLRSFGFAAARLRVL